MPFDPSQYVFRPRPLQQYDFGRGFRDLVDARFGREKIDNQKQQAEAQLGEQQAGRRDENTRFAATSADTRSQADRAAQMQKYQQAVSMVEQARKAGNTGDWNTADALAPRILELGGKAEKVMGPDGIHPIYRFEAPGQPGASPVDYAGQRNAIFGGGQPGQPFQVPGFGANGQRNPFDSLPGASSAALPQAAPQAPPPPKPGDPAYIQQAPDPAGPPPGAAGDGPQRPMDTAPQAPPVAPPEQAPQQPAGSPPGPAADAQSNVGPNPFDPFKIDTAQVGAQNELRMKPFYQGAVGSIPDRFQPRLQKLNEGVGALNLPPDEALKLWQPAYNTAAGLMKSELGAEAASARASVSAENAGLTRSRLLENDMRDWQLRVAKTHNLDDSLKKLDVARGAEDYAESALHGNGQAATQLTSQLFRMNQSGVMTDKDFEHASQGAVTIWQAVKNNTLNSLFKSGITLDQYHDVMEVLNLAKKTHVQSVMNAEQSMWVTAERAGSAEEHDRAMNAIMSLIPREYWTPEVSEAFGIKPAQKTGPVDKAGNYPVESPAGGGKTSASASASVRKKRIIDKDAKDIKDEELPQAIDELEQEVRKGKK